MDVHTLAAMALALGILAATPGPGVLAVVSRAAGCGFRDGAMMSAGIALGDTIYFLAALTGWSAVAGMFGEVFWTIRMIAAAALVLMGLRMIRASLRAAAGEAAPAAPRARRRAFVAGFLLTLGNPKATLFYLAFLPTFIDLSRVDALGAAGLIALIVSVVGGVMLGYAALAARAASAIARPAFSRWMHRGAGTVLIGAGATVAIRG